MQDMQGYIHGMSAMWKGIRLVPEWSRMDTKGSKIDPGDWRSGRTGLYIRRVLYKVPTEP